MLKVVLHIDARSFPQSVKETIAMDMERRWNGIVKVVSVERIEPEQMRITDIGLPRSRGASEQEPM